MTALFGVDNNLIINNYSPTEIPKKRKKERKILWLHFGQFALPWDAEDTVGGRVPLTISLPSSVKWANHLPWLGTHTHTHTHTHCFCRSLLRLLQSTADLLQKNYTLQYGASPTKWSSTTPWAVAGQSELTSKDCNESRLFVLGSINIILTTVKSNLDQEYQDTKIPRVPKKNHMRNGMFCHYFCLVIGHTNTFSTLNVQM